MPNTDAAVDTGCGVNTPETTTGSLSVSCASVADQPSAGPDLPTASSYGSDLILFPPTRVSKWAQCPLLAKLEREVEPNAEWTPNKLLGIALDAGLTHYYKTGEDGIQIVLDTLRDNYVETDMFPLEGLEKMLERAYNRAVGDDLLAAGKALMVDESLGVGRPDLIQLQPNGKLIITDRKFTLRLDSKYQMDRLSAYETDPQFIHYAWEAEELTGLEVEWLRVHLIIGSPSTRSVLHPWRVNRHTMAIWLRGYFQTCRDMTDEQQGKRPLVGRIESCQGGKFGKCSMFGWCHQPHARDMMYHKVGTIT